MRRNVSPEDVGGEAGERLRQLYEAQREHGLSDEEMAEKNRIITAYMGSVGVVELPDLDLLGITDYMAFIERLGTIHADAQAAYQEAWFLEAISLRMLALDFLLRVYIANKKDVAVPPDLPFGRLLGNAKDQNFPPSLADELETFNDKRNEGIHRYLLGQGSYQGIGVAYRNADGLFERIMDVLDLPAFGST